MVTPHHTSVVPCGRARLLWPMLMLGACLDPSTREACATDDDCQGDRLCRQEVCVDRTELSGEYALACRDVPRDGCGKCYGYDLAANGCDGWTETEPLWECSAEDGGMFGSYWVGWTVGAVYTSSPALDMTGCSSLEVEVTHTFNPERERVMGGWVRVSEASEPTPDGLLVAQYQGAQPVPGAVTDVLHFPDAEAAQSLPGDRVKVSFGYGASVERDSALLAKYRWQLHSVRIIGR